MPKTLQRTTEAPPSAKREEGNGSHVAHASFTAPERSAELGTGRLPPPKAEHARWDQSGLEGFSIFLCFPYTHGLRLSQQLLHSIHLVCLYSGVMGRGQRWVVRGSETRCSPEMQAQKQPRLPVSAWPRLCDLGQKHFPLWHPESSGSVPYTIQLRKESESHSH